MLRRFGPLLILAFFLSSCGVGLVGAGVGAGGLARMGQVNDLWSECVNSWGYTPSECDYAIAGLPIAQPMPAEVPQPTYYPPAPAFSCRSVGNSIYCD